MADDEEVSTNCPMCHADGLILAEDERDIPYFGKVYIFSMTCNNCKFHKGDIECVEQREPTRYSIEVSGEEDMKIRVVRSSNGLIKIPHIMSIEPGEGAQGYVTNVEGVLRRMKAQLEMMKDDPDDEEVANKARNMLKKLNRVMFGEEKVRLIIEDPTGNSAIVSDKAVVEKLKVKK
ncbi:MAG TPA: ZPR1 zinc finger domain-containing protein [Candidatus Nanoarchaeia archaeon]|nr:ZPR1 zinc finger domain-containing protein [Candidatus Nanoarchaeia archaeon]